MKRFAKIYAILIAIAFIYLASWSGYRSLQGDSIEIYPRFLKGANGEINYHGGHSPAGVEAQSIVNDTMTFTHRVIYPVAPHFKMVEPEHSPEAQVAEEIKKVILDSLKRIEYDLSLDYDGQALAVRQHANPETISTKPPRVKLFLLGTASPEAVKYGIRESLKPDHLEMENDLLAIKRLQRTGTLLLENFEDGIITLDSTKSEELQLENEAEVEKAILNPSILDSMRYVDAKISIITQKVKITPATAPIALPLWIGLLTLAIWSIYRWFRNMPRRRYAGQYIHTRPRTKNMKFPNLWWLVPLLAAIVIYIAFILLLPFWVILVMMLAYLIYAIYIIYKYADFSLFWFGFLSFIVGIIEAITRLARWLMSILNSVWDWWKGKCGCCKFFIILSFILLLLWVTGVMHVTFVWPF